MQKKMIDEKFLAFLMLKKELDELSDLVNNYRNRPEHIRAGYKGRSVVPGSPTVMICQCGRTVGMGKRCVCGRIR